MQIWFFNTSINKYANGWSRVAGNRLVIIEVYSAEMQKVAILSKFATLRGHLKPRYLFTKRIFFLSETKSYEAKKTLSKRKKAIKPGTELPFCHLRAAHNAVQWSSLRSDGTLLPGYFSVKYWRWSWMDSNKIEFNYAYRHLSLFGEHPIHEPLALDLLKLPFLGFSFNFASFVILLILQ